MATYILKRKYFALLEAAADAVGSNMTKSASSFKGGFAVLSAELALEVHHAEIGCSCDGGEHEEHGHERAEVVPALLAAEDVAAALGDLEVLAVMQVAAQLVHARARAAVAAVRQALARVVRIAHIDGVNRTGLGHLVDGLCGLAGTGGALEDGGLRGCGSFARDALRLVQFEVVQIICVVLVCHVSLQARARKLANMLTP